MTVREQLETLRSASIEEVKNAARVLDATTRQVAVARQVLGDTMADALELGVSMEGLAALTGLSTSTVRKYAARVTDEKGDTPEAPDERA